jgi:hypothetical protein
MTSETSEALLARLRRNTLLACGVIALLALAIDPQRPRAALGVLGGGLLIAISYAAVAFTLGVFLRPGAANDRNSKQRRTLAVVVFASHYALLAFAAYVMIGRLRLHPIGLLGGVTSLVVAVAAEAVRWRRRA